MYLQCEVLEYKRGVLVYINSRLMLELDYNNKLWLGQAATWYTVLSTVKYRTTPKTYCAISAYFVLSVCLALSTSSHNFLRCVFTLKSIHVYPAKKPIFLCPVNVNILGLPILAPPPFRLSGFTKTHIFLSSY